MRSIVMAAALLACGAGTVAAQTGREALRAGGRLLDDFNPAEAVPILKLGLDPNAGPRDELWVTSLHRLVLAMQASDQADDAPVWLRWAFRIDPDLPIDRDNFPPAVTAALDSARAAIEGSALNPARVRPRYRWPTVPPDGTRGALRIRQDDADVNGQLQDGQFVDDDTDLDLAVGTHTITVAAVGFLGRNVSFEILPGVTTILEFSLVPSTTGLLSIASHPWGAVYIDGEEVGFTDLWLHPIPTGDRRVRVLREGYLPWDTTITVAADDTLTIGNVILRPGGGS